MTNVLSSVKKIWDEIDYAQRRSFELKTGVPVVKPEQRKYRPGTVEELEALYALDAPERD